MRVVCLVVTCLLVGHAVAGSSPVLVVEDVHGDAVTLVPAAASVQRLVILCSDRGGSKFSRSWLAALRAAEGLPDLVEIANLESVPWVARPFVRRAFRDSASVLLDWKGVVRQRYGFDRDRVNVYLLDRYGNLLLKASGTEPSDELAQFIQRIRHGREESVEGNR